MRAHVEGQDLLLRLEAGTLELALRVLLKLVRHGRGGVLGATVDPPFRDVRFVPEQLVGHYSNHLGASISLWVKRTGSPPIGKSRRSGQPT